MCKVWRYCVISIIPLSMVPTVGTDSSLLHQKREPTPCEAIRRRVSRRYNQQVCISKKHFTNLSMNLVLKQHLRITIHWEANIITDENGKATFDFYTSDEAGQYLLTVEGLDLNGRLGRKTLTLDVK